MEFVELSAEEFGQEFGQASFLQSIEMYRRYQNTGREAYLVGVKNGSKVIAKGLMVTRRWHFGKKIFRVAGGWLLDYNNNQYIEILKVLTNGARDFARAKDGIMIEIAPDVTVEAVPELRRELENLGYKYLGEYEQVKWIYTLDLAGKSVDEVLAGFRQSHRRALRKAEREKVTVRELADEELEEFRKIMLETGERKGFLTQGTDYFRTMKKHFGAAVQYMVAERNNQILAVAMMVGMNGEMVYLYGGSRKELQKYGGSYALQWEMIKEALKRGYRRYNFYGVRPVDGDGVYAFKCGFRGKVEELVGTFVLPIGILGKIYSLTLKEHKYGKIK